MIDTDLIVKLLREHGHTVDSVFHVPENAGEYEFSVDGTLLTLAETRLLLEREDDHEKVSAQSIADSDRLPAWGRPGTPLDS
jgi:hypothetical protein